MLLVDLGMTSIRPVTTDDNINIPLYLTGDIVLDTTGMVIHLADTVPDPVQGHPLQGGTCMTLHIIIQLLLVGEPHITKGLKIGELLQANIILQTTESIET